MAYDNVGKRFLTVLFPCIVKYLQNLQKQETFILLWKTKSWKVLTVAYLIPCFTSVLYLEWITADVLHFFLNLKHILPYISITRGNWDSGISELPDLFPFSINTFRNEVSTSWSSTLSRLESVFACTVREIESVILRCKDLCKTNMVAFE